MNNILTMANLKEMTFRWTIKNFDMCTQLPGEGITSPSFSIDTFKLTNFKLWLYPRGEDDDCRHVSLFLRRNLDDGPEKLLLKFEMCLVNAHGSLTNKCKSEERERPRDKGWGFPDFYKRDLLFELKDSLLLKYNLTVECRLLPMPTGECPDNFHEKEIHDEVLAEVLSCNIAEILKSGIHSDMSILVHGETFHAHKAILECRCPKLMARLKQVTISSNYTLPDIEPPDVRQILHYLYSGILPAGCASNGLFTASRTYGLTHLCDLFPYPNRMFATTDINVTRASFKWFIADISKFQEDKEHIYHLVYDEDIKKRIQMILTIKHSENGFNDVPFKIIRESSNITTFIRCKVTIGNPDSLNNAVRKFEHIFTKETNWETSLCSDRLLRENLSNDTLNLFFEISVSNGENNSKIDEIFYEDKLEKGVDGNIKNLKLLQKDLQSLHNNPKFSDVALCVGDTKLPAHKAILCGRSKVFARMFEHDMMENQKGIIVIDDIDLPTVKSMLLYIYCGYIKIISVPETIYLYAAADKYELLLLKEKCSTFLKSNLNTDDVGEILLLADAHHDEGLRKCVYDFLTSNAKEVLNSEKFLSTLNTRLDVYRDVSKALLEHIAGQKSKSNS